MKYDDWRALEELREKGAISEEEFQREKNKILNSSKTGNDGLFGLDENTYLLFMHLSQFLGFLILGLGFAAPIVLWLVNSGNKNVDKHGKNIANFVISMVIYYVIALVLCFLLIGFMFLPVLGVLQVVFIILAAIKAAKGEYWKYPLTITFFL